MSHTKSTSPSIRSSSEESLTFIATTGEGGSEFETYHIVQDRLYQSDFDRELKKRANSQGAES
jgi:hypothetical protein